MSETAATNTNKLYFSQALLESLASILRKPVTIVEAPMGYGKTVAVREFLRDKPVDVIWIPMASERASDLWEIFWQGFEQRFPQYAEEVQHLRVSGFPSDAHQVYEMRSVVRNLRFERPLVIVVDDYHLVNSSEMSLFIETIVYLNLKSVHGVLITRDTYRGNAESLRLKGMLDVIGKDHFTLSKNDIITYYRECGVVLSEQDAELLLANTEGWISALYLYLLRYLKDGIIALPLNIYELVELEIFAPLSGETRRFLLAVCPFKSFSYEQADFAWDGDNTHELIAELRFKNAFVVYDDQSRVFRMHSIFLQFLERVFSRLSEEKQWEYHTRCGDWFFAKGQYFNAIAAYDAAQNAERMLQAIEEDSGASMTLERWDYFCRLLDGCPAEIKMGHPHALALMAISAFLRNDKPRREEFLGLIEQTRSYIPHDRPEAGQLGAVLEVIRSFDAFNDIEGMAKHYQKAGELMQEGLSIFDTKLPTWTMGSPSVFLLFHRQGGKLQDEIASMNRCLPIYYRLMNGHGMGGERLFEAEAAFFAGELDNARILTFTAETAAKRHKQLGNIFCAKFLQMRLAVLGGQGDTIRGLMDEMRRMVEADNTVDRLILQMLELAQNYLFAMLGEINMISNWMRAGERAEDRFYVFALPFYYIIHGHVMLLDCEYAQLIGSFTALVQEEFYSRHVLFNIYANLYIAIAEFGMSRRQQAVVSLERALEIARPNNLCMPFAEHYDSLRPLLALIREGCPHSEQLERIDSMGDAWERGLREVSGDILRNNNVLTKREKELARLVCEGKSNREVAEELFLAQSTVKRALVVIFRKLSIGSRSELAQYREYFEEEA